MLDRYNRNINYLRISVTDRCNLRCTYCMPAEGVRMLSHDDILSYDEIAAFTSTAVSMGVDKVRITGGEPLVRRGITSLVSMLADIDGIRDLSMTTNGVLLPRYAKELKEAGLQRVNISIDTLDPPRYKEITRVGNVEDVLKGVDAALEAGLTPVKINCVINNSPDEPDAVSVAAFCKKMGLEVRFIEQMSLERGEFTVVHGGDGGNCAACNRLRLTADGKLRPCLFNDEEIDVRNTGYRDAIIKAIALKPECGSVNRMSYFYNIGG